MAGDGFDPDTGSAYIFKKDGDVWIQTTKLTGDNKVWQENFGYSVSISGDYAIVGSNKGSAYIFKKTGMIGARQLS